VTKSDVDYKLFTNAATNKNTYIVRVRYNMNINWLR